MTGGGEFESGSKICHGLEPDLRTAVVEHADLVSFSCDKLLGGPQAGIITGKKSIIAKLSKHPLMRVLRVDKVTIASLVTTFQAYLHRQEYIADKVPVYKYANRTIAELDSLVVKLSSKIDCKKVDIRSVSSKGYYGGGTLPEYWIESRALLIEPLQKERKAYPDFAHRVYQLLLQAETPILSLLIEGKLLLDVLAVETDDLLQVSETLNRIIYSIFSSEDL